MLRIALAAGLLVAVAGIAPGCAAPGSGIQAGEHVTVYVSMPLQGAQAIEGRGVVRGARLALADAQGKTGQLAVRAVYLDDTGGRGAHAGWTQAAAAANARRASEDSTAIAYVGDLDSGATRSSLPITNQARMLQVSPASAAVDLVQPFLGAGDQVPEEVQGSGERTFGRVIPSDQVQAEAAAVWAKRLGAKRLAITRCDSPYGKVVGAAFASEARALGIDVHPSARAVPNDLIFLAAQPDELQRCFRRFGVGSTLIGTDALLGALAAIPSLGGDVLFTSAAQDPSQLPPAGQRFVRDYSRHYGQEPARYAAYGYEAMAVVLDSILRAGDRGDDRDAVVNAFFETQDRHSVLGTYSIDEVGDTTLDRLAGYRIARGRPVFNTPLRGP